MLQVRRRRGPLLDTEVGRRALFATYLTELKSEPVIPLVENLHSAFALHRIGQVGYAFWSAVRLAGGMRSRSTQSSGRDLARLFTEDSRRI